MALLITQITCHRYTALLTLIVKIFLFLHLEYFMFAVSWLHSNQISYCVNGLILWCDGPWESAVPPAEPHILLSVISHCTIEQVGLSMGIHCPPRGLISDRSPHFNVPWDRWDCPWESTSILRSSYPTVCPIPLQMRASTHKTPLH